MLTKRPKQTAGTAVRLSVCRTATSMWRPSKNFFKPPTGKKKKKKVQRRQRRDKRRKERDLPMDSRPHGKASRKRRSSFEPKWNIFAELTAEVSNTSAFRRKEGVDGERRGRHQREEEPPSRWTSPCLERHSGQRGLLQVFFFVFFFFSFFRPILQA